MLNLARRTGWNSNTELEWKLARREYANWRPSSLEKNLSLSRAKKEKCRTTLSTRSHHI
jgi:hypothetical protein